MQWINTQVLLVTTVINDLPFNLTDNNGICFRVDYGSVLINYKSSTVLEQMSTPKM